jgi:hypothetical protein
VQRVNAAGATQWSANGVPVVALSGTQFGARLARDGGGGVIVTWQDSRTGANDIYAQRLNGSGVAQWTVNGRFVCTASGSQSVPRIVSDGQGGAIIAWRDNRAGGQDVYAQRINSSGTGLWAANGVVVCDAAGIQNEIEMVSDDAGGAVMAWQDGRAGNSDIFAQRIDPMGVGSWVEDGERLCGAAGDQEMPEMAADGTGGAIVVWRDRRSGSTLDVYGQRIRGDGFIGPGWPLNGLQVSAAAGDQDLPAVALVSPGTATVVWSDGRSGTSDIYAQCLGEGVGSPIVSVGEDPGSMRETVFLTVGPNPVQDRLKLEFTLPEARRVSAAVYDLAGRRIRILARERGLPRGVHRLDWDARDEHGQLVHNGVYFIKLVAEGSVLTRRVVILRGD